MTSSVPLKDGELLVPIKGTAWANNQWKELEILSSKAVKGITQYWVKMTDGHGFTTLDTLNIGTLRQGWERKEKFYRVGVKYKFASVAKFAVSDTYKIVEVYHIDNPLTPADSLMAFAVATDAMTQKNYGTSLTLSDFNKMVRL